MRAQGNPVLSVCGVARYRADIKGSLLALAGLFPFCSETLAPLQVTQPPTLCHLTLKTLSQPTG